MAILKFLISLLNYLIYIAIFAIPIMTVVFFIRSLIRYLSGKKANKNAPGTIPGDVMRERKIMLIITSILMGLFVTVVVCLIATIPAAVAYM
jgi:hypothetical protein